MSRLRFPAQRTLLTLAAGCLLASATSAHAAIIYVDESATGLRNGSTWQHAFNRLRPALLAARSGDEVRIAQGTYCPAQPGQSRVLSFIIPAGASVVGGFAGDGAVDPDAYDPETFVTTLTGDINGDDGANFANVEDNCHHVVTVLGGGRSTILRGVTVSGGNADGATAADGSTDDSVSGISGAGIAVRDAGSPSILECVIELNQAAFAGAGVHAPLGSPLLRRCVVQDNRVTGDASIGGAAVLGDGSRVQRCEFLGNAAGRSGGALVGSNIAFTNCDFEDNSAGEFGGAVIGNDLDFTDCFFIGNSAMHGGALRCANATLTNCTFEDNTAERRGGAILAAGTLRLSDSTFALNTALTGGAVDVRGAFQAVSCLFDRNTTGVDGGLDGGAIALRGLSNLINCSFLANVAGRAGGAISLDEGAAVAVNCLLSGNRARRIGGAIHNERAAFEINNCAIVGNLTDLHSGPGQANNGGAVHNRHGGTLRVHNSLLWGNTADGGVAEGAQLFHEGGVLIIKHSHVQGWSGAMGGDNNTSDDPLFIDADGPDDIFGTADDDLRLQAGSPARDAGDNALLPRDVFDIDADGRRQELTPLDLLGERRVRDGNVDRGPIEFGP